MTLRLYNTLTSRKESFEPAEPGHARVYVCGPTVYDYAHLGHGRSAIVYDVLVRHLRANRLKVTFVRNVTDVDDKILKRAAETQTEPTALASRFAKAYTDDMHRLGNLDPDIEPRVSTHIDDIIALVQRLVDGSHAYVSDGDVYFAVESFPEYGKLSHRDLDQLKLGASERLDEEQTARKRHPADFALWKQSEPGALGWESPWGRGRPGWHIECSTMSMKHLGDTLDIHGGGLDLVFPHHDNEIAQSEAATGKLFSRFWMHNGFVEVDKEKMSKSLGNFFTARELFDRVEPEAIRYFMMTVHYRAPLNLDWTLDEAGNVTGFPQFEEAEHRLEYLYKTKERLRSIPPNRITDGSEGAPEEISGFPDSLGNALDDDLNMPIALAQLAEFLRAVNELCDSAAQKKGKAARDAIEAAVAGFEALDRELGLGGQDASSLLVGIRDRRVLRRGLDPGNIEARIAARTAARKAKSFQEADRIRNELKDLGVELFDSPKGTTWTITALQRARVQ
jgi:cysteinyl-tRNA synthetase